MKGDIGVIGLAVMGQNLILNMNFGASHEDTMASIQHFAEKVTPHFS